MPKKVDKSIIALGVVGAVGAGLGILGLASHLKSGVVGYWSGLVAYNVAEGKNWYTGLPYTWWWGLEAPQFVSALPWHVLSPAEPLWSELSYS